MFRFAITGLLVGLLATAVSAGPFGILGGHRGNSGCGSASSGNGGCGQATQACAPATPTQQFYTRSTDGTYTLYVAPATQTYYAAPSSGSCSNGSCGTTTGFFGRRR